MSTIKQIAQRARVSVGTVDRVIHSRGRVSPETAKKVKAIIEELDYKPNVLARSLSRTRTFNFGVMIPGADQDGFYWQLPINGIQKAQNELTLYKVKVIDFYYEKYSEENFQDVCNSVLACAHELDGLIIAPVLSVATERFIAQLPKNLPYIFIDSYLPNSNCLSYVGENSYQSGVLAARLMDLLIPEENAEVAVIKILPMDYHLEDRARGFVEHTKNLTISTYSVNTLEQPNAFFTATEKIVQEKPNLKGIFTPNSCAFQVAECIKKIGRNDIKLIGYELIEKNIEYVRDGSIDILISQRAEMQGYEGVYSLHKKVVLNQDISNQQIMPLDVIMKENLDSYLD